MRGKEKCIQGFGGVTYGNDTDWRIILKLIVLFHLVQDKDRWQALSSGTG